MTGYEPMEDALRTFRPFFLSIALIAVASCTPGVQMAKLPQVDRLPKPSLPSWIASISPTAQAASLSQIRVIFAKPVTKVESLEGDGPREVLSHIRLDPPLKGRFVVLTPKMVGFVADQALPLGSRVRVTLTAGLRDLDGDALGNDLAWTFETQPLAFSNLPTSKVAADEATPEPVDLRPSLKVTANAPVDLTSLSQHAALSAGGNTVALDATLELQESPEPGSTAAQAFDASQKNWVYTLKPRSDLAKATTYALSIAPGVESAQGNLPTTARFTGDIRTYDPLAVTPTPKPDRNSGARFANGDPVVTFNNPLDPKTIAANVTVSPAPASLKIIPYPNADDANGFAIDPYTIDPNAQYTITIGTGLKDTFGQSLGSAQTVAVQTGDFAPGQWVPTGTTTIPAGSNVALNYYATNLPRDQYHAAFASMPATKLLGDPDALSALPAANTWPSFTLPHAQRNKQSIVAVPVQQQLHSPFGVLAYGFWSDLDSDHSAPQYTGIVHLTNLGVFAQWFPTRGIVLVQHLDDGSPVSNARINLYRLSHDNAPAACAQGATNAAGEYDLAGTDLERCYVNSDANNAPAIGVTATEGSDVATVQSWDWSGIYRFDVSAGWSNGTPISRGSILSDRQLYQPGEHAQLTGIAYYVTHGAVIADRNATYNVTMQDPSNATTSLGSVKTDNYGIFTLPLSFSKQQALGYYSLTATGPQGNKITGDLRVAEFKPPNFKLDVALDKSSATTGASVNATASAAYLFGAPLQGGKAHAYVTRELASIAPKGWDDYSFGRQWFWPEQQPSVSTDVLQKDLAFDADGKVTLGVDVPRDLPFPMTYRVDVEATDVSNLSVSDSKTFLAMPTDALIGLNSDVVGAAGKPMPIKVIVTDADGHAVSGRSVHLDLQKMTFTSVSKAEEGGEGADQSIKYDTVSSTDVTSGDAPVTATLTPTDAGSYRVRANFSGASDASATDMQVFAFGENAADFGGSEQFSVRVTLDKKKYRIGDTAHAVIGSPFAHADVYLAVIRHDTIYRTVAHNVSGAPSVSFVVTPDMLPNAALEAVVVRRGERLSSVKAGTLDSLARVGLAPFNVDVSDRYLTLKISPQHAQLDPGSSQSIAFTLHDVHGKPIRGKIVTMVVNDAILQLSGYRLPDLVQMIFADQPISTRFADNREEITLQTQTPPLEKGFGYGGGFLEGAASTRVRKNFQPLAYYGTTTTGADGSAQVSLKLPDDLTTWRVMAVAIGDDDGHFATSDATFISRLPLMLNPLMPQFARPQDRFDLGTSAMNQTGSPGSLALSASVAGALAFASGDPTKLQTSESVSSGMQAFRFPVIVGTPAPTTVNVSGQLAGASDAFSVPFQVRDRATTESVIDSGASAQSATIPVAFDQPGLLMLTLANSAVPQFAVPADRAMTDDSFDLADTAASRLIIASSLAKLAARYHLTLHFEPSSVIDKGLHTMLAAQRGDGGFGYWQGAKESDPFVSGDALEALAFARDHGVSVDASAIARAQAYAVQTLANPARYAWCNDDTCKLQTRFAMLWALAASGDRRTDFLQEIVARADSLCSADQLRLARYLLATPGWQSQGSALADRLQQTLYVTGRYSTANVATRWGWTGSLVAAQAQMLQLLLERHAPAEQIDGAVRGLVAQQCKCGWPTIDTTASAVQAIDAYAAQEHLAPMSVRANVGQTQIASATFGSTAGSQTFTVATSSLHGGSLVIAPQGGQVHYTVLYTYGVPTNAPGTLSAFRVTREIRNVGDQTPLATMDLAPVNAPVELAAGRVFDIGIRVIADHPVDDLVIEDPLPAGFEAVDTSFATASQSVIPQSDSWEIDTRQIYADRVMAFASHLGPGIYEMHYLVRSVTPGEYRWPGARAYLHAAPEQFGRSATAILKLK